MGTGWNAPTGEGRPWQDASRTAGGKPRERKVLTAMFVDIVRSSAMVAGRDPEDADDLLLSILTRVSEAVPRYEGTVTQMLGDGFLATFGAPGAKEDHALRACLAAQDILAATRGEDGRPLFHIRIGISSGDAVTHVLTSGQWADYRMVGECVHMAAKLQQRAASDSAQLSRDTLDLIPVGVTVRPMGSVQLAETVEPMPAFLLDGARAVRRTAADLLSATDAPCVGREAEVATLFATADSVEAGAPAMLLLQGEAGIGKSRLVGEFLRAPRSRRWTLLQWPQMPVRRLTDPDDLEAVALSLAEQVAGRAGEEGIGWVCAAADRRAGRLAGDAVRALFRRPSLDPLWPGLDPAQRLSLGIDGLTAAVLEMGAPESRAMPEPWPGKGSENGSGSGSGRPLLVLVEDAHWARPVMVRLLDRLAAALPGSGSRLLLLATRRPPPLGPESQEQGWMGTQAGRRIELGTLTPPQVQVFLAYWLGPDWSLTELKAQVATRCQGVPLYLEEVLRTLEASNAIEGTPGAYRLTDPDVVHRLPRSLHGLLAERMDLLTVERRRLLMNAAVIGTTFDIGLLQVLTGLPVTTLNGHLDYLERAGFVLRTRLLPNLEYSFKHALIQEVAYATLTRADRRALHARVLDALRHRRDEDLPNRLDLLAHHAFMAENWPVAHLFGRRAGVRAELRSRLEDASRHYHNALDALGRAPDTAQNRLRRIDGSIALARAKLPRGQTDTNGLLEQARRLSLSASDPRRYARASSMLAAIEWAHGHIDRAIEYSQEGLEVDDGGFDLNTKIQLLGRLGGILAEKGRFAEGSNVLEAASLLLSGGQSRERYGLAVVGEVGICANLARTYAEMGLEGKAIAAAVRAVDAAEYSAHNFSRLFAFEHISLAFLLLSRHGNVASYLDRALEICEAINSRLHRAFLLGATAYVHVLGGKLDDGFRLFAQSLQFARSESANAYIHQVHLWFGETCLLTGQVGKARQQAALVLEASRKSGRLGYSAKAQALDAEAAFVQSGGDDQAVLLLRQAEQNARRLGLAPTAERCAARREMVPAQR
ncbi:ATP-binding protein [Azospirillum picis]|uniref:Class 3 adenylate cyclase/tetratricopeptide (TPR) repeat protein n=1 Tax=Azospirillum picis TaxID=488438 RepID=A0ABU0MCS6_9PROT|nr:adenylate/guanylate cyclase domain-containing protein [Azospirillum picis]MBP2297741.1 class 3 adenylate cyclase/tetratricopeptide (TPR) repeat protein [Azospirillum picis]MDQ0531236.1 class 3 adenylate cyclase/tetratricopeptide (TPR) repeat protein [Azospirillum picis]